MTIHAAEDTISARGAACNRESGESTMKLSFLRGEYPAEFCQVSNEIASSLGLTPALYPLRRAAGAFGIFFAL